MKELIGALRKEDVTGGTEDAPRTIKQAMRIRRAERATATNSAPPQITEQIPSTVRYSRSLPPLSRRPLPRFNEDTPLFDCLNYFQTGRSHMALVVRGESPALSSHAPIHRPLLHLLRLSLSSCAAARTDGPPQSARTCVRFRRAHDAHAPRRERGRAERAAPPAPGTLPNRREPQGAPRTAPQSNSQSTNSPVASCAPPSAACGFGSLALCALQPDSSRFLVIVGFAPRQNPSRTRTPDLKKMKEMDMVRICPRFHPQHPPPHASLPIPHIRGPCRSPSCLRLTSQKERERERQTLLSHLLPLSAPCPLCSSFRSPWI